jgi:hypothetical protein
MRSGHTPYQSTSMAFLMHFLALSALGLVLDRVAYRGLKETAGSFWPVTDAVPYSATVMPRMVLLPIGAAILALTHGSEPSLVSLTGLTLCVLPTGLLCLKVIRGWLSQGP